MKRQFRAPIAASIAIGVGLVVLLGYFFGSNAAGDRTLLGAVRDYFLQGAIAVAGVAVLIGVVNLVKVHVKKIRGNKNSGNSFALLLALLLTLAVGAFDMVRTYTQGDLNLQRTRWIFDHIQLPIEISLMAVLAISLTFAAARLLSRRLNLLSAAFVGVVLILLLGSMTQITKSLPVVGSLRTWLIQVPAMGGARGILLGIALGTIATGLRILMGSDRPYGG